MSLESALAALPLQPEAALKDLVLVWAERRAPEIAALVDRLDARLSEGRPPLAKTDSDDTSWDTVARKKDFLDVGRLTAQPPHPNEYADVLRFEFLLKHHGVDPRIAGSLARRIDQGGLKIGFWWSATSMVKRLWDPRMVAALERALATWSTKGSAQDRKGLEDMRVTLTALVAQLAKSVAKAGPLSSAEQALVEKLWSAVESARVTAIAPGKRATAPAAKSPVEVPAGKIADALALVTTQTEKALAGLLDAWRASKATALAELIEQLGPRVERPALPVKPANAALADWLTCERAADPADVDRLIAALRVGTVKQMVERLELLAARREDPRLARAALAIFEDQPFSSPSTRKLYASALLVLDAMHDPRTLARLEHLKANRMPGLGAEGGTDFRDFFAAKIERALKAAHKVAPAEALAPDDLKAVEDAVRALPTGGAEADAKAEAALLAAIWAAPDDDAPRQVYADWLQERSRPHGEFIALQLARKAGTLGADGLKRERELLGRHARAFLGPISPAIQLENLQFERGFVIHAELSDKRSPAIKDLCAHPAWATLQTFWVWTSAQALYPELVEHLRGLGAKSIDRERARKLYAKQG